MYFIDLTVPVWIIPLSQTLSSSSIYLVFNDTSPINNTIITYTLFRDGVLSVDSENNGTSLSITDDTGLQAGTVYEYEVMANVNGETTERSDKLQICTSIAFIMRFRFSSSSNLFNNLLDFSTCVPSKLCSPHPALQSTSHDTVYNHVQIWHVGGHKKHPLS